MKEQLEDKCGNWNTARNQRKTEIARGEGKAGTMGFENFGCYSCNGDNVDCPAYYSPAQLYKKGYLEGCKK